MATKLKDLWLRAIALVDRGANPEARVVLTKRDDTKKMSFASMDECLKEHDAAKCKELMAAMKRETATVGTGETVILDLTKVEDPVPDTKLPEDVAKALADAKSETEAVKKALADAQAVAKAAQDAVAKMEDERQKAVFIAKAQEFSGLPGVNPDDFGPLLRKAYAGLSEEERGKFDTVLRGAVKIAQDSALFQELGAGPGSAGGDAYGKLEKLALGLVEKAIKPDGNPALTFAQAFAKVCETPEGRRLYAEYDKEQAAEAARRVR